MNEKDKEMFLVSYNPSWIPEPNPEDFDTWYEYQVAAILTRKLFQFKLNIKVERSENKYDRDIIISQFDYRNLKRGLEICAVEAEKKRISFPENGDWPSIWPDESFLDRKIRNQEFLDNDIYLLVDKDVSENTCFWETFGEIRNCGTFKLLERTPNRKDRYWRRKHSPLIGIRQGWKSLIEYIVKLEKDLNK